MPGHLGSYGDSAAIQPSLSDGPASFFAPSLPAGRKFKLAQLRSCRILIAPAEAKRCNTMTSPTQAGIGPVERARLSLNPTHGLILILALAATASAQTTG